MDTDSERNEKTKASKWTCNYCTFENFQNVNVCEMCYKNGGTNEDGHQSNESHHEAADQLIPPNLGGNQINESHESPPILADVEVIINRLENEIKQQYEDAKSAIKSKQHSKSITRSTQHIIEQLDEASRLLSKPKSDESPTSANRKSKDKSLKQKRKGLMAEREKQWVASEENLLDEFKDKRKHELFEIEKGWTDKWKREMDEKWSTIELYLKDEQPEKEMDICKKQFIDKFTSDSILKWEGMKNMWEMRNNNEWTAHQQIMKSQWDKESDQLWTVEKLNYIKEKKGEVVSKADTGLNTDSMKINEILGICKTQIANIFKTSKSVMKNTEKTLQTTEMHMSKSVEGCQELHNIMADISTTMQLQHEELKTLKDKNEELKTRFTVTIEEMETPKLMMGEDHNTNEEEMTQTLAKTEQAKENQNRVNTDVIQKLKAAIDRQKMISKGLYGELQSVELKWKHEHESWESQRQQLIKKQKDLNQVIVEMKFKHETDLKEWQDKFDKLTSSECQFNRLVEKLKEDSKGKIDIGAHENPSTSRGSKELEASACSHNKMSSRISPIDRKVSEPGIPIKILENMILPDLIEINILVIGDCTSLAPRSSRPIIINALANYISSNCVPVTFEYPSAPLIDYQIEKNQGQPTLVFSSKDLCQQEFNLTVPWLNGCTFRFIQSTHPLLTSTADITLPEMEGMFRILSHKPFLHGIIVTHYPAVIEPLPAKLLSLIHKNAAKNLIFIDYSLNDESLIQPKLSSVTGLQFDPRVFYRYKEFRENYVRWTIAHYEGDKATLERIKDSWCASAVKWREGLLRMISPEVVPHDSRESQAVTKATMLCKDVFGELINALKDLRSNAFLADISKLVKEIEVCDPNDPQRQRLKEEINRLTGEYESCDMKIRSLLTKGIMLDNYLKDNAIVSEQSSLKQRIVQTIEGRQKATLNSGLKDYLQRFFDLNQELRFKSKEEILNLEI